MSTQWDDILTVTEVQEDALSASSAVDDNTNSVVEHAIRDAQDDIKRYIGRDPIIHRTQQGVPRSDWIVDKTHDPKKYRVWADDWPIVEVESPSEVSIGRNSLQFQRDTRKTEEVDYFAGWRRADQSLSDISSELTDLGTEPDRLPDDIRRTALRLALFYLTEAEHQTGVGRVEQAVGSAGTMTVEGVDTGFVDRQLSRLDQYKDYF